MSQNNAYLGVTKHIWFNDGTTASPVWVALTNTSASAQNRTNDTIETNTKINKNWGANEVGRFNWDLSLDGVQLIDKGVSEQKLEELSQKKTDYRIGYADITDPENPTLLPNTYYRQGCATLSNLSNVFNDGEAVTFSASLQGDGELKGFNDNIISWSVIRTGTGITLNMSEDFTGATPTKEDVLILDPDGKIVPIAADGDVTISTTSVNVVVTLTASNEYLVKPSKKIGFSTSKTVDQVFLPVTG